MKKLIMVTGMKRSASTWMYNTARLAYELEGMLVHGAFVDAINRPAANLADVVVIKTHEFVAPLASLADHILFSLRDEEGQRESMRRFGLQEDLEHHMVALFDHALRWNREADSIFQFEWIMRDKLRATREVLDVLGLNTDHAQDVHEAVEALQPPAEGRHPVTLLHAGHRTGAFNDLGK